MADDIAGRVALLEERIEAACGRAGRGRDEIRLMGVTKFYPVETVEAAWDAGIRLFGESRVQEGTVKFRRFRESHPRDGGTELHLIGSLQRNKAKAAAAFFDCIQSVDRDSLIEELGALCAGRERPLRILLEYRTGEESKSGFPDRDSLFRAAEKVLSFPGLKPAGLMTIAPFTNDASAARRSFRELAAVGDEVKKRFPPENKNWACLSMGMTNDFETAIEEGSNLIRIGTALFGERKV
jgi:pyridoxal phosphate enzyme (YggS family)